MRFMFGTSSAPFVKRMFQGLRIRVQATLVTSFSVVGVRQATISGEKNVPCRNLPLRTGACRGRSQDRVHLQLLNHVSKQNVRQLLLRLQVLFLFSQHVELGFFVVELFGVALQQSFLLGAAF